MELPVNIKHRITVQVFDLFLLLIGYRKWTDGPSWNEAWNRTCNEVAGERYTWKTGHPYKSAPTIGRSQSYKCRNVPKNSGKNVTYLKGNI